ncbi:unnamed protein product [Linum tenue]|uniref:CCHC-type domain-containing protein n=1 Tax=Linum tenue TaxID=586396 RepID=A0AAV0J9U4_9ROSI|nr:unnamed protein product [Linum tenue]
MLTNCFSNGGVHFHLPPVASTEKEELDIEIIDESRSMNGAVASSSSTNHVNEINGRGEEEKHCSSEIEAGVRSAGENDEEEEKERLRELGNLIGLENLKALLGAEGGRRDVDAHQGPGRWRRRRRRRSSRQKKVLASGDQIRVQQPPDLPLDRAEVEKRLEKSSNRVETSAEDNLVPRKLSQYTAEVEKKLETSSNRVKTSAEDNLVLRKLSQDTAEVEKKLEKTSNRVKTYGEDNLVLRKLLRRPRYFDPPTDGLLEILCPHCGQEGHIAKRCALQQEKKPCFLCGSFDHAWKHCGQSRHVEEGCHLEEEGDDLNSEICLRCRESGHDMLSCKSDYSPDDLKVNIAKLIVRMVSSLIKSSFYHGFLAAANLMSRKWNVTCARRLVTCAVVSFELPVHSRFHVTGVVGLGTWVLDAQRKQWPGIRRSLVSVLDIVRGPSFTKPYDCSGFGQDLGLLERGVFSFGYYKNQDPLPRLVDREVCQ